MANAIVGGRFSSLLAFGASAFAQFRWFAKATTVAFTTRCYRTMSYQLRKKSLAREVHRVVRNELEGVLKQVLAGANEHRSDAIHEARNHLKKTRALVRLL